MRKGKHEASLGTWIPPHPTHPTPPQRTPRTSDPETPKRIALRILRVGKFVRSHVRKYIIGANHPCAACANPWAVYRSPSDAPHVHRRNCNRRNCCARCGRCVSHRSPNRGYAFGPELSVRYMCTPTIWKGNHRTSRECPDGMSQSQQEQLWATRFARIITIGTTHMGQHQPRDACGHPRLANKTTIGRTTGALGLLLHPRP